LFGRGLLIVISENHAAHLRGADICCQVDAHALLFKAREILSEGAPVERDLEVFVSGSVGLDDGVVERSDGRTFAGNLSGDALENFRGQAGIDEDRHFRLAEHVDKAGSDDLAGSIDGASARGVSKVPDGCDFVIADTEVGGVPGRTGAVDDVAVGDDQIEGGGASLRVRTTVANDQDYG